MCKLIYVIYICIYTHTHIHTLFIYIYKFTLFSSVHRTFLRTDHTLDKKTSLSIFKKTEIILSIFSDYKSMRLEINHGLPQWLSSKESACSEGDTGDVGSIPGSRRSPGVGHRNPLQYSCWEKNAIDRGVWQAKVHRVTKSQTQLKCLSMHACRNQL